MFGLIESLEQKVKSVTWKKRPGEVDMANALMGLMEVRHNDQVVKPAILDGSAFVYNVETGIWDAVTYTDIEHLIQCFNGTWINKKKTDDEDSNSSSSTPLTLSSSQVQGAAKSVYKTVGRVYTDFFMQSVPGVTLKDGFLAVSAGGLSLVPHSPDQRSTYAFGFSYEEAKQQGISYWLEKGMGPVFSKTPDQESAIKVWQEFMGACIIGKATQYQRCLIFQGPGSNGKSTLCDVLASLFSPKYIVQSNPSTWGQRFSIASLQGAKLNVITEMANSKMIETDKFKRVITGEDVQGERKQQNIFFFKPTCGHILATNTPISSNDNSDGFWRRVLIIPLSCEFKQNKTRESIVDQCMQECGGILLWALEGAVRLMQKTEYTEYLHGKELADEQRNESDPIRGWMDQYCIIGAPNSVTTSQELWESFSSSPFFKGSHISYNEFGKQISAMQRFRKTKYGVGRVSAYVGIAVKGALPNPEALFLADSNMVH